MNRNKMRYVYALLCAVLCLIPAVMMIYPGHVWGGDFSQYIAQARALATGSVESWYEKNAFIISHSGKGLGIPVYPWGLPFILAPLYALFGEWLFAFKLVEILFLAGSVFASYLFFEKKTNKWAAFILALFMGLNPVYIQNTESVLSDIPCMFFSILAVIYVEKHLKESVSPVKNAVLSGFFIFCAVQMRSMALSLLAALICYEAASFIWGAFLEKHLTKFKVFAGGKSGNGRFYDKKWQYHLIPYVVFLAGTNLVNVLLPKAGESYADWFKLSFENMKMMWSRYYAEFYRFLGRFFVIILILAVVGMLCYLGTEFYLATYVLGTFFMLLIYEYYPGARCLFSIVPFLFLFSYYGVEAVFRRTKSGLVYYIAMAGAVIVLAFYISDVGRGISFRQKIDRPVEAYSLDAQGVYDFIAGSIDKESVVYFFKPRVLYLNTDVYSYTLPNGTEPSETLDGADYLLLYENDGQDTIKAFVSDNSDYQMIYYNDSFMLYQCP